MAIVVNGQILVKIINASGHAGIVKSLKVILVIPLSQVVKPLIGQH